MIRKLCGLVLSAVLLLSCIPVMAAPAGPVTEAGVFPIVSEPTTLKILIVNDGNIEDYKDNYYTKWLEEKTGLTLEFEEVNSANAAEKVQLLLAADTLPDMFFGVGRANATIFSATNIIRYGEEGQILPLNEYIEMYGVNTKALFEKYSEGISLEKMMTSGTATSTSCPASARRSSTVPAQSSGSTKAGWRR